MPKISYLTAIDYYIITCYGFVVFSILEFAFVHQDKFDCEELEKNFIKLKSNQSKSERNLLIYKYDCKTYRYRFFTSNKKKIKLKNKKNSIKSRNVALRLINGQNSAFISKVHKNDDENYIKKTTNSDLHDLYNKSLTINKIDHISKILFPISFTIFNFIYFFYYLNKRSLL